MSRPFECRRVSHLPEVTIFTPADIPQMELEVVSLSFEEVEAIRLKDLEGLEQEAEAERMNISRPTIQRILFSARQKLADALLNGNAIRIEGGNFEISLRLFRCSSGHEWNMPLEELESNPPLKCPICNTSDISPVSLPETVCARKGRRSLRSPGWGRLNSHPEKISVILPAGETMLANHQG
jgi:uncharacterized protein